MLTSKLFRNCTPYINRADHRINAKDLAALFDYAVEDPSPTMWGSRGFAEVQTDEHFIDVQGAGLLCMLQFNERILPGKVRDEKVRERVAKLEDMEGRRIGKKAYREIRDEVEHELLPKAFIRRTFIPVLFAWQYVLVFSSSAKKCGDVVSTLLHAIGNDKVIALQELGVAVKDSPAGLLYDVATQGGIGGEYFVAGTAAVLKGKEKRTVRVKDRDMLGEDMQALIKQGYSPEKLQIVSLNSDNDDDANEFVLSDKLVLTGLHIQGVVSDKGKDSSEVATILMQNLWLIANQSREIIDRLVEVLSGIRPFEQTSDAVDPTDVAAEEDDGEL